VIALRLVHLIENHSDELADGLMSKLHRSPRTRDMRKVPAEEMRGRIPEILQHLSVWLLSKSQLTSNGATRNWAPAVPIKAFLWLISAGRWC